MPNVVLWLAVYQRTAAKEREKTRVEIDYRHAFQRAIPILEFRPGYSTYDVSPTSGQTPSYLHQALV